MRTRNENQMIPTFQQRIRIAGLALLASGCTPQSKPVTRNSIDGILESHPSKWRWKSETERATDRAFDLEKKADVTVEYTMSKKMDIKVGRLESSHGITARHPTLFDPSELIWFFEGLNRKDLIVVMFHKNTWSDDEEKREISKINSYFRDRGYKRIVIQQFRSWGRPTLSDIRN